ncbi:MAG: hypothetical protein K6E38_00725 [Fretibacterium sp.]|nr:hypothetical protein [Fretibacterium sp.]
MKLKSLFPWLLMVFALALTLLVFWMVGRGRLKPRLELMISNVSVGVDFEDHPFLAGTASRFAYGTRQVCLRFDYSRLEEDTPVVILWDMDGKRVQAESYELLAPSGTKMYCLLREDGSPLPRGSYAVIIQCGPEFTPTFHFEIY